MHADDNHFPTIDVNCRKTNFRELFPQIILCDLLRAYFSSRICFHIQVRSSGHVKCTSFQLFSEVKPGSVGKHNSYFHLYQSGVSPNRTAHKNIASLTRFPRTPDTRLHKRPTLTHGLGPFNSLYGTISGVFIASSSRCLITYIYIHVWRYSSFSTELVKKGRHIYIVVGST